MLTKCVRIAALSAFVIVTTTIFGGGGFASAQDAKATKAEAPTKARKGKAKSPDQPSGRLPVYFSKVVDEKQKSAIYRLQKEYEPKIAAAKAQLEQLTKERDAKITALLTPEQQKKIEEAKAAAAKSRGAAAKGQAGTSDTPVPPAK
jgi:hypothetical protein